jgi:hypothetical protein
LFKLVLSFVLGLSGFSASTAWAADSMCAAPGQLGQNQTYKDVFEHFATKSPDYLEEKNGTGIFLVPAPEIGILEAKRVFVENISYNETIKRGQNALAFTFVPHAMIATEKVRELFVRHHYVLAGCNAKFLVCAGQVGADNRSTQPSRRSAGPFSNFCPVFLRGPSVLLGEGIVGQRQVFASGLDSACNHRIVLCRCI